MLRSFEARDRNLAELNNSRVGLFSTFIVLTMVCVGILQVFMIRNLFDTNPKGRKVWDKLSHLIKWSQVVLPYKLKRFQIIGNPSIDIKPKILFSLSLKFFFGSFIVSFFVCVWFECEIKWSFKTERSAMGWGVTRGNCMKIISVFIRKSQKVQKVNVINSLSLWPHDALNPLDVRSNFCKDWRKIWSATYAEWSQTMKNVAFAFHDTQEASTWSLTNWIFVLVLCTNVIIFDFKISLLVDDTKIGLALFQRNFFLIHFEQPERSINTCK